ncbi:hypothetical protein HDU77_000194 [Chytriomyces hyalinus]|nr:hypothetical protein HDU77_000194 [Chytriomyces hyalinus]
MQWLLSNQSFFRKQQTPPQMNYPYHSVAHQPNQSAQQMSDAVQPRFLIDRIPDSPRYPDKDPMRLTPQQQQQDMKKDDKDDDASLSSTSDDHEESRKRSWWFCCQ